MDSKVCSRNLGGDGGIFGLKRFHSIADGGGDGDASSGAGFMGSSGAVDICSSACATGLAVSIGQTDDYNSGRKRTLADWKKKLLSAHDDDACYMQSARPVSRSL